MRGENDIDDTHGSSGDIALSDFVIVNLWSGADIERFIWPLGRAHEPPL
jgi:hypothetical protein